VADPPAPATPRRRGAPDRGRAVLVHAAALLAVLLFFRLEKGFQLVPPAGAGEWLALLVPEVGFALVFGAFWLLTARLGRAPGRLWRPLFLTSVVVVYLVALLDHLWFMITGTRLHLSLVVYSVRHFKMLTGLLATGVGPVLWARVALVVLCLLLALRLERRGDGDRRPLRRRTALVAGAVGLAVVLPPWPVPYRVSDLWTSPAVELFAEVYLERPKAADLAPYRVAPEALYSPPRLTSAVQGERPNVLLLLLESTRRDVTPPWAEAVLAPVTPNLAALAPRAVVFDDVYATVSHTSKALVGILCGMYPRLDMPILEAAPGGLDLTCLPHLLREAGYRTAFLQTAPARFEQRPGLVANLGYADGAFGENFLRPPFERVGYLGLDEMAMLEPAVGWARDAEPPWFLTLLTVVPHHPYAVPGQASRWLGETQEQYLAAIHHQDRFVGAVVGDLARAGLLENTLVVVLGDHGEAFGEHRRFQHDAVPYQEVVHVPLLLLGPEELVGPPRHVGGLRHQVDLMPTLLRLAGIEWEGRLLGRDLLTTPGHERTFSFCWYRTYCMAMVEDGVKYVYHFGRRPLEAFDLGQTDEGRNMADDLPDRRVLAARNRMAAMAASVDGFWEGREPVEAREERPPPPAARE
jgi:hypothetical protein